MRYLLLRDNKESGPFTLEEIQTMQLKPSDLIWIDGKSGAWEYPTEIKELQAFVAEAPRNEHRVSRQHLSFIAPPKSVYVSLPNNATAGKKLFNDQQIPRFTEEPELETKYVQSLDEIKEMYVQSLQEKTFTRKKTKGGAQAVKIFMVAAGLLAGAFLVKKVVYDFNGHLTAREDSSAAPADPNFRNALSTELINKDSIQTVKVKPANIKKLVAIKSNDYRVGIFGGINDLKLTVYNNSPHLIDKITVKVNYLKPNGELVNSEILSAKSIRPGKSKTIKVPPTRRGVKVNYSITNIQSTEYKAALEQI